MIFFEFQRYILIILHSKHERHSFTSNYLMQGMNARSFYLY
jgi:hypothetical protein